MKFDCDKFLDYLKIRKDRRMTWHVWFAWHPVRIQDHDCRWLEKVERRGNLEFYQEGGTYWNYEYKAIE